MTVNVVDDDMMHKFNVGDVVQFILDDAEVYSYKVPKLGTLGIIEVQTHSFALEQMLGVQVPMSVVQWADGQKMPVFSHDIKKVEASEKEMFRLVENFKNLSSYSGETNN
jgi:hypothetical protein